MSAQASNEVESGLIIDANGNANQQNVVKSPKTGRVILGAVFSLIYIVSASNLWLVATYHVHRICAILVFIVPGCLHLIFGFIAQLHKHQPTSVDLWKSYDSFFRFVKIVIAVVLWATGLFSMYEHDQAAAGTFYVIVVGAEMFLFIANEVSTYFNQKEESRKEDK